MEKWLNKVICGDCLEVMRELSDNSIDAVVTDPPYGLSKEPDITEVLTKWINGEPYDHGHKGFMGKSWDRFVPHPDVWKEVYRVLKPGGHALVFAGTRTQDLMTVALRLAGFEVRDVIEFLYFSGFPKSQDVSKALDKRAGVERKKGRFLYKNGLTAGGERIQQLTGGAEHYETFPTTPLARKWDGWGTNLKPAHEPIILVRKPLIGAVVDNVEQYSTGAINIDGCRIGDDRITIHNQPGVDKFAHKYGGNLIPKGGNTSHNGRFPANCVTLDEDQFYSKYFNVNASANVGAVANVSPAELSKKASKKDRSSDWQGNILDEVNNHPTVKPTALMAWLIRLITPPNGIVLDPFAGSGSTLVAAKRESFDYIGIEMTPEYMEIARARCGLTTKEEAEEPANKQVSLF